MSGRLLFVVAMLVVACTERRERPPQARAPEPVAEPAEPPRHRPAKPLPQLVELPGVEWMKSGELPNPGLLSDAEEFEALARAKTYTGPSWNAEEELRLEEERMRQLAEHLQRDGLARARRDFPE